MLLFGASGLVGREVLIRATATGDRMHAVSRSPSVRGDSASVRWYGGPSWDLFTGDGPWPEPMDVVVGAGPLDALAAWLERVRPAAPTRLVALSSTSVVTKTASSDPAERALVDRLARAEDRVIAACEHAGIAWTLLRPTLIWGAGRDRNVSRLADLARRFGFIPLPAFATGRRQPIRARDVAAALMAAVSREASIGQCLDLPGGEILPYDEMARRIAVAVRPRGRVLRLPGAPTAWVARNLSSMGIGRHATAALERTRVDLVFDGGPAIQALGCQPSGFDPIAADFPAR